MTLPANVDLVLTDKYRATAAPNASSRQQNRASLRLCDLAKIYLKLGYRVVAASALLTHQPYTEYIESGSLK